MPIPASRRRISAWSWTNVAGSRSSGSVTARTSAHAPAIRGARVPKIMHPQRSGAESDSAQLSEEFAQHLCRLRLADPGIDLGAVEALVLREYARSMLYCTALGIGRGVIEPGNARMADRARAHRAGFERDIEVAFAQAFVTQYFRGHTQCAHLGMAGGVRRFARAIGGNRHHFLTAHYRRANRHLAKTGSLTRGIECQLHCLWDWPAGHYCALPARAPGCY